MNARERLRVMIRDNRGSMTVWSKPEIDDAFACYDDAHRTEVLDEGVDALRKWIGGASDTLVPGLKFGLGVLLSVRDDLPQEKSSPDGADATPDLHQTILDAVRVFQVDRRKPGGYDQQLAEHLTQAVAPLVPYREVWDASLPPGGRVCSICGQPVESEPCSDHAPEFFRPGRTYLSPYSRFRCIAVDRHPGVGELRVVGWYAPRDSGPWEIRDLNPHDHEWGVWADVTEAGEPA